MTVPSPRMKKKRQVTSEGNDEVLARLQKK
jgi:hypothetical protein